MARVSLRDWVNEGDIPFDPDDTDNLYAQDLLAMKGALELATDGINTEQLEIGDALCISNSLAATFTRIDLADPAFPTTGTAALAPLDADTYSFQLDDGASAAYSYWTPHEFWLREGGTKVSAAVMGLTGISFRGKPTSNILAELLTSHLYLATIGEPDDQQVELLHGSLAFDHDAHTTYSSFGRDGFSFTSPNAAFTYDPALRTLKLEDAAVGSARLQLDDGFGTPAFMLSSADTYYQTRMTFSGYYVALDSPLLDYEAAYTPEGFAAADNNNTRDVQASVTPYAFFKASDGTNYTEQKADAYDLFASSVLQFRADSSGVGYFASRLGIGEQSPTAACDLPASVAGLASMRLRHGVAPSAPNDGDVWTTTAGMYAQINGATVGPFGAGGGSVAWGDIDFTGSTLADIVTCSAADVDSGTLADARLSANIPLLNAASNVFAGAINAGTYLWLGTGTDAGFGRASAGVIECWQTAGTVRAAVAMKELRVNGGADGAFRTSSLLLKRNQPAGWTASTTNAYDTMVAGITSTADGLVKVVEGATLNARDLEARYLYLNGGARGLGWTETAADPTTAELPNDKDFGLHKNTGSGALYLAANDGGAIKKVALT